MKDERVTRHPVASITDSRPCCFGIEDLVCPRDEEGVMQPQAECLACGHVRPCLQQALENRGLISEKLAHAPVGTRISHFFRRWSDQKLSRGQP